MNDYNEILLSMINEKTIDLIIEMIRDFLLLLE